MSGNGKLWTGLALGTLTGAALTTAAYANSHYCCHRHYNYGCYPGAFVARAINNCIWSAFNYGGFGWNYRPVIYGIDAFTPLYASPLAQANANLGYFI